MSDLIKREDAINAFGGDIVIINEEAVQRYIEGVISKIKELPSVGWIPVEERLPEPKEAALIYVFYDFIDIGWFREDGDWDSELGCYDHKNITHWMPLPKPPKGDEDE